MNNIDTSDKLNKIYPYQLKYKDIGYYKNYYQHVTKNKVFNCEICRCSVEISHKARHIKTQKHKTNEYYYNMCNQIQKINNI